jgi:cell wall-associated NlpC family hydrolase
VTKWKWAVRVISSEEVLPGDLLFLKGKTSHRLITHVAIALSSTLVFHSSKDKAGGCIEELTSVFSRYEPLPKSEEMLTYVDPRSDVAFGS